MSSTPTSLPPLYTGSIPVPTPSSSHQIVYEDTKKHEISMIQLQIMGFLYNALEDGWSIKKRENKYIFTKKHEGKKEIFNDSYLEQFMKQNMNLNHILPDLIPSSSSSI